MTAALLGATVGLGLALIAAGFIHQPTTATRTRTAPHLTPQRIAPPVAGIVVFAVVLAASTWPAAALGAGTLVGRVVASVLGRAEQPRTVEDRLDAIATWCEMLRDLLRAGALLPPAIATTATTCPMPIRASVVRSTAPT
jgi:hypothetical protein